jgi:hypothetical protein
MLVLPEWWLCTVKPEVRPTAVKRL